MKNILHWMDTVFALKRNRAKHTKKSQNINKEYAP